ncbi:hypothetical protein COCSUDRAFT_54666 [Coccomyxa subellipsoidea C-169]|uniref:Uncharacterized protein n=1 Tax=Coccomyxa subellipsoidea (strain C-169) TaxID=574566 RepID=I0YLV4_COCSC|nr:hypothetical protein COCSUDRAFT_54666 [Coccomyxa subellipsoidea C-169]EIE19373.1 hypothetical protein COCSUDRAFT_54666 [Coccomyxa subellipsoidea C-169]|eukprot:XP_005643917.1 hypothetical protein COCSUDRAFT_54666 [Coccomyxa subellipsoidea C-169]
MAKEPKILDYHDILLYRSDVDLLKGEFWLNDQIVSFFFEYLQKEKYEHHHELFFFGGSLTYLLLHGSMIQACGSRINRQQWRPKLFAMKSRCPSCAVPMCRCHGHGSCAGTHEGTSCNTCSLGRDEPFYRVLTMSLLLASWMRGS